MTDHIPDENTYRGEGYVPPDHPGGGTEPAGYDIVKQRQGESFTGREVGPGHSDQDGPGYDF